MSGVVVSGIVCRELCVGNGVDNAPDVASHVHTANGSNRNRGGTMTPDEIKRTALAAIECYNDPARRNEYFEMLYEDDVVLHGYAPQRLTPKTTVKAFYQVFLDVFPDVHADIRPRMSRGTC